MVLTNVQTFKRVNGGLGKVCCDVFGVWEALRAREDNECGFRTRAPEDVLFLFVESFCFLQRNTMTLKMMVNSTKATFEWCCGDLLQPSSLQQNVRVPQLSGKRQKERICEKTLRTIFSRIGQC